MLVVQNTDPEDLNLERARAEREVLSPTIEVQVSVQVIESQLSSVNFTHLMPEWILNLRSFVDFLPRYLSFPTFVDGHFLYRRSIG